MARARVGMDRLVELVRLHRMGLAVREICRQLKLGIGTEQRYRNAISNAGLLEGAADALPTAEQLSQVVRAALPKRLGAQQVSTLESHRVAVEQLLDKGLQARAIHTALVLAHGSEVGSRSAVKRLVATIRRERGVQPDEVKIPVETAPAEVAQVDFFQVRHRLEDPVSRRLRKAWVFVMALGFSRHFFACVVFDQTASTWIRCHQAAFRFFGGVPRTVVPDNLKAAVVKTAFGVDGERALNRSYRAFARHHGFIVDPAPPFAPQKKGKVESLCSYIQRDFVAGHPIANADGFSRALESWLARIASVRVHGTTGRVVEEHFHQEEKPHLMALPSTPWTDEVWHEARVHPDSHVVFERRFWSAPWRLIGQKVWIRATPTTVDLFHEEARVASHPRRAAGHRSTVDSHLPDHRGDLRHRSRAHWESRAKALGPLTWQLAHSIFDLDDVLSRLRVVQAIVGLLERHPERSERVSARALHFRCFGYRGIKDIVAQGLDHEQLPVAGRQLPAETAYRFARYQKPSVQ